MAGMECSRNEGLIVRRSSGSILPCQKSLIEVRGVQKIYVFSRVFFFALDDEIFLLIIRVHKDTIQTQAPPNTRRSTVRLYDHVRGKAE